MTYADSSIQNGALAESAVCTRLIKLGYIISTPQYVGAPYDVVVDTGANLLKVQIKCGWFDEKRGTLRADVRQDTSVGPAHYTRSDVDVFIIYYPEEDTCYWFDYNQMAKTSFSRKLYKIESHII